MKQTYPKVAIFLLSIFFVLPVHAFMAPTYSSTLGRVQKDWPLQKVACQKQIGAFLDKIEKKREWRKELDGLGEYAYYRSPTAKIGAWLELRVFENGNTESDYVTAQKKLNVAWDSHTCRPQISSKAIALDKQRMDASFSDATLREAVRRYPAGIIYAWSPHMPFSVAGTKAIRRAAEKLHTKLFLVLDPHADPQIAEKVAVKHHFSPGSLAPIESIEMFNRGILNHFPSVILFSHGKILSRTIPGLKTATVYADLIEDQLVKAQE